MVINRVLYTTVIVLISHLPVQIFTCAVSLGSLESLADLWQVK